MSYQISPITALQPSLLAGLTECHRQTFGHAPWNEGRRCSNRSCSRKWGLDEPAPLSCPECGQAVAEFWPVPQVSCGLLEDFARAAAFKTIWEDDRLVGFGIGYALTPTEAENQLRLPGLADQLRHHFPACPRIGYQRDLAILPQHQGQGLGSLLLRSLVQDLANRQLSQFLVYVPVDVPAYTWYINMGMRTLRTFQRHGKRALLYHDIASLLY